MGDGHPGSGSGPRPLKRRRISDFFSSTRPYTTLPPPLERARGEDSVWGYLRVLEGSGLDFKILEGGGEGMHVEACEE
eukprot:286366-Amorphochlora_amoeboformis.AAC.1